MKKRNLHNHTKSSHERSRNSGGSIGSVLSCAAFGAIGGICALIVFIFIFSALCLLFDDPHKLITPLCIFSLLSASFLGGFLSQKKLGSRALLCGIACGIIFALVLYIFSLMMSFLAGASDSSSYFLKILVIPAACFGSAVSASHPRKTKRHRRKK